MKKAIRGIAFLVCFALLFTSVPISAKADIEAINSEEVTQKSAEATLYQSGIIGEITEKRTAREKHYRMDDGSFIVAQYSNPVHFEKNEKWEEIDNTLESLPVVCQDGGYRNKNNSLAVTFAAYADSNKLVDITYDSYNISWSLPSQSLQPLKSIPSVEQFSTNLAANIINSADDNAKQADTDKKSKNEAILQRNNLSSALVYTNIQPGVDLEYHLQGGTLKENFIVKAKKEKYSFSLLLKTGGLVPVCNQDGSINLQDGAQPVFQIPAPVMYDAAGDSSDALSYSIEGSGGGYLLTVTADPDWINAKQRTFPVTIDPQMKVITNPSYGAGMIAQMVASKQPNKNYAGGNELLVTAEINNLRRTYFDLELPRLQKGDVICGAIFNLYGPTSCYNSNPKQINIHELTQSFTPSTLTWNNQPAYSTRITDYCIITGTQDPYNSFASDYSFDLTSSIKKSYDNAAENCGFVIRFDEETPPTGQWYEIYFHNDNAKRPTLLISYRNAAGLEDYWDYTAMDAGLNGMLAVNNYSGNVYAQQPILGLDGNVMPVAISLHYNSSKSTLFENNIDCGAGWMLNYDMEISFDPYAYTANCSNYYVDADGTRHYFYIEEWENGEAEGIDEDGLGLTLNLMDTPTTRGTITDSDNNTFYFNQIKRLYKLKDKYGRTILVGFNSDGVISNITDGVGRQYTFQYNPFTAQYNPGRLRAIEDPVGQVAQFSYSTDGLLTGIDFSDGKRVSYTYNDSGELESVINVDTTKTIVTYDTSVFRRASSLSWTDNNETIINTSFDFEYDYNITRITDAYDRTTEYQYNIYGQAVCVIDKTTGNAQHFESGRPGVVETVNKPNKSANKPISRSISQQSVINLMPGNGGFDTNLNGYSIVGAGEGTSITHDPDFGRTGLGSLKVQADEPHQNAEATSMYDMHYMVGASRTLEMLSGQYYTISAYISTNGATLSEGKGAVLMARTYDDMHSTSQPVYYTAEGEWVRVSLTIESLDRIIIFAGLEDNYCYSCDGYGCSDCGEFLPNTLGTVWIDDIQIVDSSPYGESESESPAYNILTNPGFKKVDTTGVYYEGYQSCLDNWNRSASLSQSDISFIPDGIEFNGKVSSAAYVESDTIYSGGKEGDIITLGAWAKGDSVWIDGKDRAPYYSNQAYIPSFGLTLIFNNDPTTRQTTYFNPAITDWQYVCTNVTAPSDYTSLALRLEYNYNANTVAFKAPFINKEVNSIQTYKYDADGNLIETGNQNGTTAVAEYEDNLPTQISTVTGDKVTLSYNYNRDVAFVNDLSRIRTNLTYDSCGNVTNQLTTAYDFSESVNIISPYVEFYFRNADSRHILSASNKNEWYLEPGFIDDYYYIQSTDDNSQYLTMLPIGQSEYNFEYAIFETQTKHIEDEKQLFAFEYQADGSYRIRIKHSVRGINFYIAANDTSSITASPDSDNDNQKWYQYERDAEYDSNLHSMSTSSVYSSNGNDLLSSTDDAGRTTSYTYNTTGAAKYLLKKTTDPMGIDTNFSYDSLTRQLTKTERDGSWVGYQYDSVGRLSSISKNKYSGGSAVMSYLMHTDTFSRNTGVSILAGGITTNLVTNTFGVKNLITKITYGNGHYADFVYDDQDRVTSQTNSNGGGTFTYRYDRLGNHIQTTDSANETTTKYTYDLSGKLTASHLYKTNELLPALTSSIRYDSFDRPQSLVYNSKVLGTQTSSLRYGNADSVQDPSKVYGILINGTERLSYSYNIFGMPETKKLSLDGTVKTAAIEYIENSYNNHTSIPGSYTNIGDRSYTYEYDLNGNITKINHYQNGSFLYAVTYQYDNNNQLIRENNEGGGYTVTFTYDKAGNILAKNTYPYTTGAVSSPTQSVPYLYTDTSWTDKLTSYSGTAITYDAIGNPLSYRGMSLTWQNGRQLKSLTKSGTVINYKYNEYGIRTKKSFSNVVTDYILDGQTLLGFKTNSTSIMFMNDESGAPFGFTCKTAAGEAGYYYQFNLQGDVTAILDSSGVVVARYTYDAWGSPLTITDGSGNDISANASHIANINPIRYRGYYYDTETGFYWLQSRYYDPVTGRFINADDTDVMLDNEDDSLLKYNLYAYCYNNPVNMDDHTGESPANIVGGIIGGVAGAALGYLLADALGLKGWKKWALISAATVGGAVLGAFLGPYVAKFAGKIAQAAKTAAKTTVKAAKSLCFVAGTLVETQGGHIPIENIKAGDYVYAENPETGEKGLKQVVQTFVNQTNELVHVKVNGEKISTTPEHPFYSPEKGWMDAIELRAGDKLVLRSGEIVIVESVQHEILETPITVYNFEVEDFHTYYVTGSSVLVHNTCSWNKLSNSFIKKTLKLDAHAIKKEFLHKGAKIASYDLAVDKTTGIIWIIDKAGKAIMETYYRTK